MRPSKRLKRIHTMHVFMAWSTFPLTINTFPRVLKAVAQPTRSSQRTSAEERDVNIYRLPFPHQRFNCSFKQLIENIHSIDKLFSSRASSSSCSSFANLDKNMRSNIAMATRQLIYDKASMSLANQID